MMRLIGGNLGQRERCYFTTWALVLVAGALTHYGYGPAESSVTLLVTMGGGIIASYTIKTSAAGAPAKTQKEQE